MASMHDKYRSFPTLDAFSRVFPAKKPIEHFLDVAQCAFCVRICAHLAWGTTLAMPTWSQKLGSSHACLHMHHVQAGPFGSAGGHV